MSTVAFDTETRGLDWFDPEHTAFLASWATGDGEWTADLSDPAQVQQFIDALEAADTVVAHNLSFDVHQVREAIGYDLLDTDKQLVDTDLMSRVIRPSGQEYRTHGLKDLAVEYLDSDAKEHEEHIDEMAKSMGIKLKATGGYYDVWRAYPEVMEKYARFDARYTYDLYGKFSAEKTEAQSKVIDLEHEVAPVLIRAEQYGVAIDQEPVLSLKEHYERQRDEQYEQLVDTFGEQALGGEGSQQALLDALDEMGVPLYRKTDTGRLKTDKFALQEFEDDFPILRNFGEYRTATKFLSTYIEPMVGRETVHPSFMQCGAWTGRMSCRRPNMQNIPARAGQEVREMFVPRPGYSFVVCDYESIEVRLLAWYLNDPAFRQLIDDGHDPHAWMAANIHGGEPGDFAKGGPNDKVRSEAKNTLFAITYGAGAPRVSDMNKISKDQAKALISKIKSSLPNYYRLNKRIRAKVEGEGYVSTLWGRTQLVNPDKAYVGLNALIQGSAADVMKQGLVNVNEVVAPLGGRPLLVVHDEVVVEVPTEYADEGLALTTQALCSAYDLKPSLEVAGTVVHTNYAEAK